MLAHAKLNLYLHVTGKRDDGYHLLESLMLPIDLADVVEVAECDRIELTVTGEFASAAGDLKDNIVIKAANTLAKAAGRDLGAKINLEKNIPAGAGLGGGSSDAAAVLKLLNDLWKLDFPQEKLAEIGLGLGADVPFCFYGKPAFVWGIGEKIVFLSELPKMHILLVNPMRALATAKVFTHKKITFSESMPPPVISADFIADLAGYSNDLEENAIEIIPEIMVILDIISGEPGCILSRMSGSGATCFGIFSDAASLEAAAAAIAREHQNWWVRGVGSL